MALLGLLLGLALSLTTSDADIPQGTAAPPQPIRVLSASHKIDFPNEVVFVLEAEADSQISEVRLFYQFGRQKVRIYGYPDFTPASRVTADFTVKTGGSSYLPSGVDIAYYYVIRDSQGHTFESERFYLEYKDPAFKWQRLQRGDLIVLWHDRPLDSVAEVASDVALRLEDTKQLLGLETVHPMKAVILNSAAEAGRSFPVVSGTATRGHLFGGFAFGELDVFVLVGMRRDGMVHEMTHLLLDEALDSPLAKVPSWLNEGLAMYFESGSRGREATLTQAARGGRLIPLRAMGRVPGRPSDVRLFYAQAGSLVNQMIEAHGPEKMGDLLAAINEGDRVDEAVLRVYGVTLEELERKWRTQLGDEPSVAPVSIPGTLGSSVIIAGAVAIAVVTVVVRWLRNLASPPDAQDADG